MATAVFPLSLCYAIAILAQVLLPWAGLHVLYTHCRVSCPTLLLTGWRASWSQPTSVRISTPTNFHTLHLSPSAPLLLALVTSTGVSRILKHVWAWVRPPVPARLLFPPSFDAHHIVPDVTSTVRLPYQKRNMQPRPPSHVPELLVSLGSTTRLGRFCFRCNALTGLSAALALLMRGHRVHALWAWM